MVRHPESAARISIHAPREGGDSVPGLFISSKGTFQSTPPARGATKQSISHGFLVGISIHAPREGGDTSSMPDTSTENLFQSTPPARGATRSAYPHSIPALFQSTPPARGATEIVLYYWQKESISIHAPREGGDCRDGFAPILNLDFNPRPPRGGRRGGE